MSAIISKSTAAARMPERSNPQPSASTHVFCPHCGAEFEPPKKAERSYPQLKRFHALIRQAFLHWPDAQTEFRPRNREHLRHWLQKEAGHFEVVKTIVCKEADSPKRLTAVLTAVLNASEDDNLFVEVEGLSVVVKRSVSISYAALAHLSACALFGQIDDVLKSLGLDPDKLLQEEARAA
jgi:hypothetical protein